MSLATAQRQVEHLDVATDVGIDAGGEIFQGLARRMSHMTLAQTAEKPITVATEEAISNFADSR
jgi:hypothetical protein